MEFLSERILRLAGLEAEQTQLNEGLAEEAVDTHQPYQTEKTVESAFHTDEDEEATEADHHKVTVDYAIKESNQALVESRLRDAIRAELKAILEESDSSEDEDGDGNQYGATGFKKVERTGRRVSQGFAGVGFKSWNK